MSDMSYMEKLMDGVEIEWKTLEEVANFSNGKGHEKAISNEGKYIVVNSKFISTDGKIAKYSDNQISPIFIDDILIVMSDLPNGKALAKTFIVDEDEKYTLNQRIGAISVKDQKTMLPKFLNYFLNRTPQLTKYNNGVDQTNLRKDQILDVPIPIPCPKNPKKSLEIQAEIVRILDAFTELTTELTAELTARKKQYNYYRDQLLSFEEGDVEWKTLGEVANIKNGKDWKLLGTGDIPVYGSGGVMQYVDTFAYDKPTVLIPRKGSITNIFYVDSPFWNVDTIYYTEIDTDQIIPKFLYYFMKTIDMMQLDTGSGRPSLTQAILNQMALVNFKWVNMQSSLY